MRKILKLGIVALFAISVLFAASFFAPIPLGEPILSVEISPNSPWHTRPGGDFQVDIGIMNGAWLLATARDVRIEVVTPLGFTISGTDSNEWQMNLGTLHGGERRDNTLTVTVGGSVPSGNYDATISVLRGNSPDRTLTLQVVVELPYIP